MPTDGWPAVNLPDPLALVAYLVGYALMGFATFWAVSVWVGRAAHDPTPLNTSPGEAACFALLCAAAWPLTVTGLAIWSALWGFGTAVMRAHQWILRVSGVEAPPPPESEPIRLTPEQQDAVKCWVAPFCVIDPMANTAVPEPANRAPASFLDPMERLRRSKRALGERRPADIKLEEMRDRALVYQSPAGREPLTTELSAEELDEVDAEVEAALWGGEKIR